MLFRHFLLVAALIFGPLPQVRAHHGLDFLLVQDAYIPHPGALTLFSGFDWTSDTTPDQFSAEPGAMIGIIPGIAFGIGSEISDVGDGWNAYTLSPYFQAQLLPSSWSSRVRVALRVGYDISLSPYEYTTLEPVTITRKIRKPQQTVVVTTKSNGGGGSSDPGACGPDAGPDAPPCPDKAPKHVGHGHSTTTTQIRTTKGTVTEEQITVLKAVRHQERVEGLNSRLIIETDLSSSDRLVLNLTHFTPNRGTSQLGYAAGIRHAFSHDFAMSIEALGSFEEDNWHQAILAAHIGILHHLTFKIGGSVGLTKDTPDFSLHTGFVFRF